jgi:type II/III secretion system protein/VCBS repeat protein
MSMARWPLARLLLVTAALWALPSIPLHAQGPPSQPATAGRAKAAVPAKRPIFAADEKKASEAYKQGLRAEQAGKWEPAYDAYSDAVNWAPENQQYFVHREIARSRLVQSKMDLAEREAVSGRLSDAREQLRSARFIDPTNRVLQERYAELTALRPDRYEETVTEANPGGPIQLEHLLGTRSFNIRGSTSAVYQEIARQFGVEVAFDADMRSRQIQFRMSDLDFPTALRLLGRMTGTFWRPLTKHLFFVADDTVAKRKDYDISIVRTVLLPASETPEQMTELLRLVRDIAGITRSDLDTRSGTLTMRASPQAMAVATGLIDDLEKPNGGLVLEVEILEVNRNYARLLGLTPPDSAKLFSISKAEVLQALASPQGLATVLQEIFGTPSSLSGLTTSQIGSLLGSGNVSLASLLPPLIAFGGGYTTFLTTLPGAAANFSEMLSLVRNGRRILLRTEDGKPATFFVGSRFPVTLAQFSPSFVGVGGNVPGVLSTNFPETNLPTGNAPTFVTTGLLRNTGSIPDMIVANNADNTLSIFLGNGDGTFQNPTAVKTGVGPVWIATGNFNTDTTKTGSDQNLDVAVVNQADNSVSIFLGNGTGGLNPAPTPTLSTGTGSGPASIVATTLTTSGFTDLVAANHANNTLSVFLGNGDGTFKTPVTISTGRGPSSIAAADLNADGKIDLAVTNQLDNTVSVFLGKGDGTFQNRTDYVTGNSPVWVATGDFTGNTVLDLAVANNGAPTSTLSGNTVSILLGQVNASGNPTGTFGTKLDFPAGNGPTSIAVADYNIDGRLDLVVTDQTDNAISLLLGLGGGLFGPNLELPVETNPVSVATADFNAAGRPDVAVANRGSNTVTVILNESTFGVGNALAATPFPGVQYLDIGVKVKATPRMHPNDEVTLQLKFDVSSLGTQAFNGIPVINNQEITQTVRLKENETTAIAGILQPQDTRTVMGLPGVGDLPGIGMLGSTVNNQKQELELLILITPRTVLLSPHKDHVIYAGHGLLEGPGSFGPTRQERQANPSPQPQPPPQEQPPQQQQPRQPPPQPQPENSPQTQPQPPPRP